MLYFHLGTHPELGFAELSSRYPDHTFEMWDKTIARCKEDFTEIFWAIQQSLGGCKEISREIGVYDNQEQAFEAVVKFCFSFLESKEKKKLHLGLSGDVNRQDWMAKIKSTLKSNEKSCRVVLPKKKDYNTAEVAHNRLCEQKGIHLWVLRGNQCWTVHSTVAVQDIRGFSERDYDKPKRSPKNGMLPPKLALMMLNLAHPAKRTLDPFCGSGTVLLEGMKQRILVDGSDIANELVSDAKDNVTWFADLAFREAGIVKQHDATKPLAKSKHSATVYDAIVTEGTLGPVYKMLPHRDEMRTNIKKLLALYKDFFSHIGDSITADAKIVICFPRYQVKGPKEQLNQFALWHQIKKQKWFVENFRATRPSMVYSREHQIVQREVVVIVQR
jgi:tRNA G10  N-methylase Trm11